MIMSFGKYQGYELTEIPYEYLLWVRTNVQIKSRKLKQEIEWRILEIEAYWQECEELSNMMWGDDEHAIYP